MSSIGDTLKRYRQRAFDRVRGEPNIEWLVARGLQLGEGTHIAHPVYFDRNRPWLITIGDYANLGPYVAVITHDASLHNYTGQTRIARVVVGKRVMIGVGAVLLPGTIIGEDSVVGAGTVVRGEIPPGSLVVGNPAKVSPLKAVAAWHYRSAADAPKWPLEGWTMSTGITEERKREQQETLADGTSGYVPANPAPGSPYMLKEQRSQQARDQA